MIRVTIELGHLTGNIEIIEGDPLQPIEEDSTVRSLQSVTLRALKRAEAAVRARNEVEP